VLGIQEGDVFLKDEPALIFRMVRMYSERAQVREIAQARMDAAAVPARLAGRTVASPRLRTVYYRGFANNVEKQDFDAQYVRRLAEGDPSVEEHFTSYFGQLLRIKLRRRRWSSQDVEDIRQETFLRVLQTLRQKGGLEHPERLGAFVNAVCNNIILEFYRSHARNQASDLEGNEPVDCAVDLDGALVAQERKELVRGVLAELPEADRAVLRMVFLEETGREEICRTMKVDRGYLRVLLHRALMRFKVQAARTGVPAAH
jgi:RNA polymerase sigma-70 factor (ECF subfamily)